MADLVETICDHFASAQTAYGRPDPSQTPFASGPPWSALAGPTTLHSPPFMALALYRAGRHLGRGDYIAAADRYTLFFLSAVRDPMEGRWDVYSDRAAAFIEKKTGAVNRSEIAYLMCRSWMLGIGLNISRIRPGRIGSRGVFPIGRRLIFLPGFMGGLVMSR